MENLTSILNLLRCQNPALNQAVPSITLASILRDPLSLRCSQDGTANIIKLFFNTAQVKEQCEVNCGNKLTFFQLETTLNYIRGIPPFLPYLYTKGNTSDPTGDFLVALPDIAHFLNMSEEKPPAPNKEPQTAPPLESDSEHEDACGLHLLPEAPDYGNLPIETFTGKEKEEKQHSRRKRGKNEEQKQGSEKKRLKVHEILESIDERLEYIEGQLQKTIGKNDELLASCSRSSNTAMQQRSSNRKTCLFCNGTHFATQCTVYETLTARDQRAKELGKCTRCLYTVDHSSTDCPSQALCFYCKKAKRETEKAKHHAAFCIYHFPK
ncbi:hypothetical protein OSTOST_03612 [Ostertagia ostertagi]